MTLTYLNEDDKAYGLAGMAISLAALDAIDRVAGDLSTQTARWSRSLISIIFPVRRQFPRKLPGITYCAISISPRRW